MKRTYLLAALMCLGSLVSFGQSGNTSTDKQFLLIFRFKSNFTPPSQDSIQANIRHWQEYMGDLGKTGKPVSGFRPSNEGETISGTAKTVHKGVYVANNELVSSFIIIKAASMNEAGEIAKKCPIFDFDGSVEIRPLQNTAN
ncbi:YciI family protein [Chitinophaga silvisoli]|uniref:Transcription initiation protein n=1 Tax=Chitinophaga silvisoli TaxID=2291814 RepID=A0A3E1NWV6_9BACT|nr:YciI family protein [Chitinophaga silvisoli]RFM32417.1 transcription initiation protein [Chitinophaga silvisoli]